MANNALNDSPLSTSTKSPFSDIQRREAQAVVNGGFDMTTAADVGVKVLVAAAAGTIIYNQFAGNNKPGK